MHTLIIPSYYPNTYSKFDGIYFKIQSEALYQYGLKVGIIAPIIIKHYVLKREKKLDYGFKDFSKEFPILVHQIPSFPIFKWINDKMRLHYGKKLFKRYVDKNSLPDIVHVHSFENGIIARWIKKKYNIPFVITEHSTRFERNEYSDRVMRLAQKVYKDCNQCIVVSPELQKTIKKFFNVNTQIIPNLVNTDDFTPITVEKKYDFISIGGLREPKNYTRLINCMSKLNKETDCNLIIIGEGPLKTVLSDQIKKLKLENRVSLLGAKTQNEIIKLLNESKIFVSSSIIETFGVAIIEGMCCGLPVVATKSGGPEYFLTEDFLGQLCNQSDESLSTAMKDVLNNYDTFDSNKIRKFVEDRFSARVVATQIAKLYEQEITSSSK